MNVNANRVLVADADDSTLETAHSVGSQLGCSIVTAETGKEAYGKLRTDSDFSGAVFNIVLPYLDAPQLLDFMRTERRLMRIPVVVMAERQCFELVAECYRSGVLGLLQKPFTGSQLASMLNLLWRQRQKLLEASVRGTRRRQVTPR